jgi:hypothetical protein
VSTLKAWPGWLESLSEEDLAFIKRFVLASGSLKEVAAGYGVSYPTVRLRLNRLIDKIEMLESHDQADAHERMLRGLFAEGKLDETTFRQLSQSYQSTRES